MTDMDVQSKAKHEIPIQLLVELENGVAALYDRFAEQYPEDRSFWLELRNEEYDHGNNLKNFEKLQQGCEKKAAIASDISQEVAEMMVSRVHTLMADLQKQCISRKEALWIALQLEQSAGEFHYRAISGVLNCAAGRSPALWKDDFDHAARIRSYIERTTKVFDRASASKDNPPTDLWSAMNWCLNESPVFTRLEPQRRLFYDAAGICPRFSGSLFQRWVPIRNER